MPWSRWHWLIVVALGATWILDGLEVTLAGSLAGILTHREALGLTDAEVGASATFYLAGAVIGALLFDDFGMLRHVRPEAALGIAYNVLIAFAWAHWAWIKIATAVSVTVFSLSMLIIPVVGVLSGMLFLGERPTAAEFAALGLVLAALVTVLMPARAAVK